MVISLLFRSRNWMQWSFILTSGTITLWMHALDAEMGSAAVVFSQIFFILTYLIVKFYLIYFILDG